VLVVLAREDDQIARRLVARWSAYDACLLTTRNLSRPGWRQYGDAHEHSTAVIDGRIVPIPEIRGVLTRLPYVPEQELAHIIPSDRAYVAAEMTAFLTYWLSTLTCPVVNRPTPSCLMGPGWQRGQWIHMAARLGLPVGALHSHIGLDNVDSATDEPNPVVVTVVGNKVLNAIDDTLAAQALQIARAAAVDVLRVHFGSAVSGTYFACADLEPDLSDPQVSDAVLEHMMTEGS
jgi:hypothetical protein